jgi:hypothetical protein
MLNGTNFHFSEYSNGSSSVTWILYTAYRGNLAAVLMGNGRMFGLSISYGFQSANGWSCERRKIRRLITDKRCKRSRFVERLVRLDEEAYERHASVGARGEWIGD